MFLLLPLLLMNIVSLGILGGAGYLIWSWYDGDMVRAADGTLSRVREDWRLWTGVGLLAWSFLGRLIVLPLIAGPDRDEDRRLRPRRENGRRMQGATGSNIYFEMHGPDDAQPIILIHGWGLDSTVWDYAKRELSRRYHLIVWDLPGLGHSSQRRVDLDAFADDLKKVVDLTGERRPILVGHSIGGMTIQTLVRKDPDFMEDRIAGAVLLNTTHTRPQETMVLSGLFKALRWPVFEPLLRLAIWLEPLAWLSVWQSYLSGSAHIANRLGFAGEVTRSQLETTTRLQARNRPAVQAKGNLAMMRWDATEALSRFPVPVLVIGGEKDLVTKADASRTIAKYAPDAELVLMDFANHMGPIETPEAYASAIEGFVVRIAKAHARDRGLLAAE